MRAIVVDYACHCTTLDPKDNAVSGDWAGYAQSAIEADHPGCVALTLIGCGADSNPIDRPATKAAIAHGRSIADEVNRLLSGPWVDLPTLPEIGFERFRLPFDTLPTRPELERLVKAGGPPGYNASVELARLDRGEPLPRDLPYSVQTWKFGDKLLMVFLPGEVVVDYVLRLKTELDPGRIWVTAYANDVPCYIPSERILREGGYEGGGAMVYYGRPTRLKPGVEQLIIDSVHRLAGNRFTPPAATTGDAGMPPPLSPAESLRSFHVKSGLKLELVAAEPLVESPVAIDFGADGKLWVCEMRDYPSGTDGNGKPGGVIKVLEDRDGDGRYDSATPFLEGLAFPTGVMAWRKGVLICAAPEIIYAEDTNGDGTADLTRTLFRGFATENYQARVNGLSYGIDNWVYGANGLIGGTIHGTASGREFNIGGRDFRFKPDTGEFEPASGLTQQGRVHDNWGNQFGGNNGVLIQHYPLPDHYARRNPRVAAPVPAVLLAADDDPSRLFPASRTLARYNDPQSANHVTSACSPLIYRDDLLGADYSGNAFTCEPVHNLVHRLVVEPHGATFSGHRAADEARSEFLASTDSWCRPVQVRTGPDGALWVVDMYRFVIEHPRWISPESLKTLDVRAGADRGRIYRLVPANGSARNVPRLDNRSTPDLAAAIDHPNGTMRDTVQRLIVDRADSAAVPVLSNLVMTASRPEVRAQALGALEGLRGLESSLLLRVLQDPHPGVRRQAVRVSEPWLSKDAAVGLAVLRLARDPDIRVRYQLALSLGEWSGPEAGKALGLIAVNDRADIWMRGAVLSSSVPHAASVLEQVVGAAGPDAPSRLLIEPLIATLAASGDRQAVSQALGVIRGKTDEKQPKRDRWQIGATAQLLESSRDDSLIAEPPVKALIALARETARDRSADQATRLAALRLLGRDTADRAVDRAVIERQLDPTESVDIQLAALWALTRSDVELGSEVVVTRWPQLGPTLRAAALDAMLARPRSTEVLFSALEQNRIVPAAIDATHREHLISRGNAAHRQRALTIFGTNAIGPRQAVLNAFASVTKLRGDPEHGRQVFARVCASCHKVAGIGHDVGPDLAALTDLSPDALLTAVLDPNREVDARYASYAAALNDGRVLTGLIAAETASAITLKRQEGQTDTILRTELEEMTASGRSLMPEGLENDLKPAEVADVFAFIAHWPARPKDLAGNRPQKVVQAPDGSIHLTASAAAVYGPSLIFESEFENLGYWHDARDHATWTFHVDRPATFTVSLDWACADNAAGNAFHLRIDDRTFRAVIGTTGSWATYRSLFLRELHLEPGDHRLDMSPVGPVNGALADVRFINLTPSTAGLRSGRTPENDAAELARHVLDAAQPASEREAVINQHPDLAADMIAAMTHGLAADRAEEYRRHPVDLARGPLCRAPESPGRVAPLAVDRRAATLRAPHRLAGRRHWWWADQRNHSVRELARSSHRGCPTRRSRPGTPMGKDS